MHLAMRKFLLCAIAACSAFITNAAGYDKLNVHLTDGTTMEVVLVSDLKLSFTDTELVAKGTNVELTVPRESIVKFVHTPNQAGIDVVTAGGMTLSGNTLSFDSLSAGSVVNVYTASGIQVRSLTAEGAVEIDLDGLTAGVYVVNVNGVSYKISVQ